LFYGSVKLALLKKQPTFPEMTITLFAQLVSLLDRNAFKKIVFKYHSDKHAKGYDSWSQLVSMLFCHLGKCQSLRDISNALKSATGNLNHLGIGHAPSKSALSYQNKNRSWLIFREYYYFLKKRLGQQAQGWGKKLHLKSKIYLLDSSTITLCLSLFDWAKYTHEKGAVKLHALLDYEDRLPAYVHISDGSMGDNSGAYYQPLAPGSIVVADRGYMDFALFNDWDSKGAFFVVRHKQNIKFTTLEEFDLPEEGFQDILKDEMIIMNNDAVWKKYPKHLRRVVVWDEQRQATIELLTNNRTLHCGKISELYRNRWFVEVFFKEVKQLLSVKTFIGTTQNAVLIQLWTALISILLLKYLRARSGFRWHLSNLGSFLRLNLLVKIDLTFWLNHPFSGSSPPSSPLQQGLLF